MKKKIIKWTTITSLILVVIFCLIANYRINKQTKSLVFNSTSSIPQNKVGLLLGTSKYLKSGKPNQYFTHRISAAEQLYKSGKIKAIVISGDNSRDDYNEPQDMKDELVKRGIPANIIYLDYAGFRTYDSVYRMKEIFGQNRFTIISQEFHNQRAIYIAKALNLNAIGFNAQNVDAYNGFKTNAREKLARVKVVLDLFFNVEPKYLGDKIQIN